MTTSPHILNAYYFRAHMYTCVPRHVREDMEWIADCGTTAVSIGVLEQDLYAARENIHLICDEAARVGMKVHAVPSRWGGLIAGCPKVPSLFSVTHPETWMRKPDGTPHFNGISGVISSVCHPDTERFFNESLERMLREFPFAGIIWDEVKPLNTPDHSAAAQAAGIAGDMSAHKQAVAAFFQRVSAHAKTVRPDLRVSLFLYSTIDAESFDACAGIESLDYFGADGRPWSVEDGGTLESAGKVLLGQATRFREAANRHGKGLYLLIENHNIAETDIDLMERRLPDVLALNAEHLTYYYYPRNVASPDRAMDVIRRHLKEGWKP